MAHATILAILALIVLPIKKVREQLIITATEPIVTEDQVLEIQLDTMPEQIEEGAETFALQQVDAVHVREEAAPLTIDADMARLDSFVAAQQLLNQEGRLATQLSGRSVESRAALLQAFGGTAESEAAVSNGLKWLAAHQRKDGSWNFDHRTNECDEGCNGPGRLKPCTVAATSLALLCFLGAGHTHLEGEYHEVIQGGLKYLVGKIDDGPLGADLRELHFGNSGMYAQGLSTIVLCEAYGMSQDRVLKKPAQLAINYIAMAQHPSNGGWRYELRQIDGDTSVSGWEIMAITSGRMSGLVVPLKTRRLAGRFLDSVQSDGGAFYGYDRQGRTPSMTAVGLLCRMYLGWSRDHPELEQGVSYLSAMGPSKQDLYYDYYATQVLHHWGGKRWDNWNVVMRDWLVDTQEQEGHAFGSWSAYNDDGSSRDPHGTGAGGRLYATCFAVLTLEVYYRHLPLYQRQAVENDL